MSCSWVSCKALCSFNSASYWPYASWIRVTASSCRQAPNLVATELLELLRVAVFRAPPYLQMRCDNKIDFGISMVCFNACSQSLTAIMGFRTSMSLS